jgi:tetratricopeptide (TPR) repeat protein
MHPFPCCYANLGQTEKAEPHYETAFRLAPGVSQSERLLILGSYYARVAYDDRKAVDAYQTLVNLYPDDYRAVNNLSNCYSRLGMQPQYVETIERLVALRPNDPNFGQLEVLWSFYRFERSDKTKATHFRDTIRRLRGASELTPGNYLGTLRHQAGPGSSDRPVAERRYQSGRAGGRPGERDGSGGG